MILSTSPSKKEAKNISIKLLEKKLAVCIQISPIKSFYVWKEK